MKVIDLMVDIVGTKHSVFLSDPDKMILVEVFKVTKLTLFYLIRPLFIYLQSAGGIGILPDYEKLRRYNVQEICNAARKNSNNEKQASNVAPTTTTTDTTTTTTDTTTTTTDTTTTTTDTTTATPTQSNIKQ
jgi:hypothetical protein